MFIRFHLRIMSNVSTYVSNDITRWQRKTREPFLTHIEFYLLFLLCKVKSVEFTFSFNNNIRYFYFTQNEEREDYTGFISY